MEQPVQAQRLRRGYRQARRRDREQEGRQDGPDRSHVEPYKGRRSNRRHHEIGELEGNDW